MGIRRGGIGIDRERDKNVYNNESQARTELWEEIKENETL